MSKNNFTISVIYENIFKPPQKFDEFLEVCEKNFNDFIKKPSNFYFLYSDGINELIFDDSNKYKKVITSFLVNSEKNKHCSIEIKKKNDKEIPIFEYGMNNKRENEENEQIQINDSPNKFNVNNFNENIKYKEEINKINEGIEEEIKDNIQNLFNKEMNEMKNKLINMLVSKNQKIISQKISNIENKYKSIFAEQQLKIENQKQNEKKKSIIHTGYICNQCNQNPIIGIRYKCNDCSNYNLCEECEEKNSTTYFHDINHTFSKLRRIETIEKDDEQENNLDKINNKNNKKNSNKENNFNKDSNNNENNDKKNEYLNQKNDLANKTFDKLSSNESNDEFNKVTTITQSNLNSLLANSKDKDFISDLQNNILNQSEQKLNLDSNEDIKNLMETIVISNDNREYSYYSKKYEYIFHITMNKESAIDCEIEIQNNGKYQWPENVTKLYCNEDSNLKIGNVTLNPLKINEKQTVNIIIERLNELTEGDYLIYFNFKVNRIIFGQQITIKIICKEDKELKKIKEFRREFALNEYDYPDEKIKNLLNKYNGDFNLAFGNLFPN